MLVHEVVGWEFGAARLARVVVDGRALGLPVHSPAPVPVGRGVAPRDVDHPAEPDWSVAAGYVEHGAGLTLGGFRRLDVLDVELAGGCR